MTWWSAISPSDAISIWISIIAVIFSVVSFMFSFLQTKRAQKTTLEAEYFTDIFKEYLREKIPEARDKIHFVNEKIDSLVDNLNNLRKNAHYFRYSDKKFYAKLKKKQQKLEDMLIQALNRTFDYDDQVSYMSRVDNSLRSIYKLISIWSGGLLGSS